MNSWNFTGNIGKDAELRHTAGGTPVCQFSVATTSGYGDRKVTSWARCSLFGKRGESLAPYLLKGQQVAVTGEVKLHEWTNQSGEKKYSLEVNASDVTLVGNKADPAPSRQQAARPAQITDFPTHEDDIPF